MEPVKVELSKPIKAHLNIDGKNDIVDISELYLTEPTYRHREHTRDIKKRFVSGLVDFSSRFSSNEIKEAKESGDKEDLTIDAEKFIQTLYTLGQDFDLESLYKRFERIFCMDTCFKDSDCKQPITSKDLEKLEEQDFDKIVGRYAEVFLKASLMNTVN